MSWDPTVFFCRSRSGSKLFAKVIGRRQRKESETALRIMIKAQERKMLQADDFGNPHLFQRPLLYCCFILFQEPERQVHVLSDQRPKKRIGAQLSLDAERLQGKTLAEDPVGEGGCISIFLISRLRLSIYCLPQNIF